jgi:hypothetical protein
MAVLSVSAIVVAGMTTGLTTAASAAPAAGRATISSTAQLSPDVARTVKGSGIAAKEAALAAYWTSDRMKAAKSDTEMPAMKAAAAARPTTAGAAARPQGPATKIDAAAPKTAPVASGPDVSPQATAPNYPVGHPVARTVGKVFFTSLGVNYVCSGSIVNSEGKSVVWTAGHCVSDGGAWNTNWTFVPNYYSGVAPYGYWYSYSLTTTTAWFNNNNDYANDVGASVMYRTNGQRIADYLGAQGIAWNQALSGNYVYAFGYPQASPFTGCCLYEEVGYTYNGGGNTIYMVNAMTGGSSGGPWLGWFDGNWGYVNGHNDFKYTASPQYMYSPYYGNQVLNVYNAVRNIST